MLFVCRLFCDIDAKIYSRIRSRIVQIWDLEQLLGKSWPASLSASGQLLGSKLAILGANLTILGRCRCQSRQAGKQAAVAAGGWFHSDPCKHSCEVFFTDVDSFPRWEMKRLESAATHSDKVSWLIETHSWTRNHTKPKLTIFLLSIFSLVVCHILYKAKIWNFD